MRVNLTAWGLTVLERVKLVQDVHDAYPTLSLVTCDTEACASHAMFELEAGEPEDPVLIDSIINYSAKLIEGVRDEGNAQRRSP